LIKQRPFHLVFSIFLSLLILAPAGYRVLVGVFPDNSFPVSVQPVPALETPNLKNGEGVKGKIKGLYMDISYNMNRYDAFYKTGFAFRDELLELYKITKMDVLHAQPFPDKVVMGKGDWLFTADRFDGSLSEQLGLSRMDTDEVEDLADRIADFQKWCESEGIFYVLLPTWGKAGIYNDSIPMRHADAPSTLEQLIDELMNQGVRVVNYRPQMKAQQSKTLFFRHDSHWNGHGAWIAYQQLMDTLRKFDPGLTKLTQREVFADTTFPGDMDLMKMLGEKSPYPSVYVLPAMRRARQVEKHLTPPPDYSYVPPENYEFRFRNDSGIYKTMVFRDSYFVHLEPLLVESFNESVLIWHRIPDTAIIRQEKPDIVIQQISERLINEMYYELKAGSSEVKMQ
jgi:hypothetical protein